MDGRLDGSGWTDGRVDRWIESDSRWWLVSRVVPVCRYCSLHGVGDATSGEFFYPDTARSLQEEYSLVNVPLPKGTTSATYLAAFDRYITPNVRRFNPDLIIISCGFDACAGDSPAHPDGYLQLDPSAYGALTTRMVDLANQLCEGRLVRLVG